MNKFIGLGNIATDIELRYTQSNTPVAQFTIALNRGKDKDGNDLGADFPRVNVWGKQAENVERYCEKGSKVAIEGSIKTGSYEKNGEKVYTTDINASRVEFIHSKEKTQENANQSAQSVNQSVWKEVDENDIPF